MLVRACQKKRLSEMLGQEISVTLSIQPDCADTVIRIYFWDFYFSYWVIVFLHFQMSKESVIEFIKSIIFSTVPQQALFQNVINIFFLNSIRSVNLNQSPSNVTQRHKHIFFHILMSFYFFLIFFTHHFPINLHQPPKESPKILGHPFLNTLDHYFVILDSIFCTFGRLVLQLQVFLYNRRSKFDKNRQKTGQFIKSNPSTMFGQKSEQRERKFEIRVLYREGLNFLVLFGHVELTQAVDQGYQGGI